MNNKIKAIIIDDEQDGRSVLNTLVKMYCPQVEIIGEGKSGEEGLSLINELNPELVFLDIDMPGMNGFSLLKRLKEITFEVIFVTAHHHYALKAIKHSALDYLLKPVDKTELIQAVDKCKSASSTSSSNERMSFLLNNSQKEGKELTQIILHVREGYVFTDINDIIRCEADGNYTKVILKNGEKQLVSKTLKDFDLTLSTHNFCRIHKSHLINIKYLKKYIKGDGGIVIMSDDSELEVSRRNKETFLKQFNI